MIFTVCVLRKFEDEFGMEKTIKYPVGIVHLKDDVFRLEFYLLLGTEYILVEQVPQENFSGQAQFSIYSVRTFLEGEEEDCKTYKVGNVKVTANGGVFIHLSQFPNMSYQLIDEGREFVNRLK